MAKFIGIHRIKGPAQEDVLVDGWKAYKEAATKMGLKPIHVSYNAQEGIAVCETEAESSDEVRAAHKEIGMLPEEIFEVKTSE